MLKPLSEFNSLPLGIFSLFFCRLQFFLKINFFENSFRNMTRVSNILDPDQAKLSVGPYLGPNCLQNLSADN